MVMQMNKEAIVDLLEHDWMYRDIVADYILGHSGCPKDAYSTIHTCPHCNTDFDYRTGYNA